MLCYRSTTPTIQKNYFRMSQTIKMTNERIAAIEKKMGETSDQDLA